MSAFGLGAAATLIALALVSRDAMMRVRGPLLSGGEAAKAWLGARLAILGGLILTGLDKQLEAALLDASPYWLVALTTRF